MTRLATTMANQSVKVSKNGVVCVEHGRRIARIREGKLLFTVNAPPTQEQLAAKVRAREAGEHVSHIGHVLGHMGQPHQTAACPHETGPRRRGGAHHGTDGRMPHQSSSRQAG